MKSPQINTKERIIQAALKLFLKKGFDNVSMSEIKKEVNITSGGFYHYFNSKDDLLKEVEERYVLHYFENAMKNIKAMDGSIRKKLELVLEYTLGIGSEDDSLDSPTQDIELTKDYYLLYLERVRRNDKHLYVLEKFNKELLNIYEELIDKAKEDDEFDKDIDSKQAAVFAVSLLKGTIECWIGIPNSNLRKLVKKNLDLFLTNFGA